MRFVLQMETRVKTPTDDTASAATTAAASSPTCEYTTSEVAGLATLASRG